MPGQSRGYRPESVCVKQLFQSLPRVVLQQKLAASLLLFRLYFCKFSELSFQVSPPPGICQPGALKFLDAKSATGETAELASGFLNCYAE